MTGVYRRNFYIIHTCVQCTDEENSYPFCDEVIRLLLEQLGKQARRQALGGKTNLSSVTVSAGFKLDLSHAAVDVLQSRLNGCEGFLPCSQV